MVPNNIICKRIDAGAIMLVIFGLVAGLQADESTLLMPKQPPGATRTISFPSGQCTGNLYLEPESSPIWDPKGVRLSGEWEYLSAAQGDVRVPEDRNIKLWVRLALSPRESAKLLAQNPWAHRLTVADRVRKDPKDLYGLSELEPNDLFWLSVSTEMYLRTGPGLAELAKLPRLERLCFWGGRGGSPISDRHIKYLEGLTQLKGLTLHGVDALTDASLASIGKLKNLEELHFIRTMPRFTPAKELCG